MDMLQKLEILADAAKYDAACTSSGVERSARKGTVGVASSAGCCHTFSADGRCISLLKVLLTNVCVYDCAYCVNRRSNDVPRAAFAPRELARLTVGFYKRNYVEGLFLSSGVVRSPDYTMELLIETLRILRQEEGFGGYVHAKAIPGCSPELVTQLGLLADRLSTNIELPSQDSLEQLAPEKARVSSVAPLALVHNGIQQARHDRNIARSGRARAASQPFAPAGQSTQLIIGATPETDHHILSLAEQLYAQLELKRVFFSAYVPVNDDARLPGLQQPVPLTREHRLYQADWLLRFYGFSVGELLSAEQPDLSLELDPKAQWALGHMNEFPVEVNTARYEQLLRVPGLGVTCAKRIVRARRERRLDFAALSRLGVKLKRAGWFLTAGGRMHEGFSLDADAARASMTASTRASGAGRVSKLGLVSGQLALFDDACQHAHDPYAAPGHGDRLLAAARGARVQAGVHATARLGATPSGLPQRDELVAARGAAA